MKNNRLTDAIREAGQKIITFLGPKRKSTIRQTAQEVGRSKSSVHRQMQSIDQRNQYPESTFWETEVGYSWLRLLVFAVLFFFGIRSGVGAESLSQFFKLIRINTHVGCSPSAIRNQLRQMEQLLPQFQELCERSAAVKPRQVTVALDETFFGDFLILVMIDLNSGYLLLEDIADDRRFDTWMEKTAPRLEQLGVTVTHAISDRARALIKMALTGFECKSGADLFHAQQDVSRFLGGSLGRRLSSSEKALEKVKNSEEKAEKRHDEATATALKQSHTDAEEKLKSIKQSKQDYHENLQRVSQTLHPFSIDDNSINNEESILSSLESSAQAFEKIADDQKIIDNKGSMKKFRNQFSDLAVSVTAWWQWVIEVLQEIAIDPARKEWLITTLFPVLYWSRRIEQTKNPILKQKYHEAWKKATDNLHLHPLTAQLAQEELEHWLILGTNMVGQFHRSSSAVEGRNGWLSQMYHNGRGFTEKRLKALTVIHNYFIQRKDGSTAAMRLFGREHPDLFNWLLDQLGELPLPRKRCGEAIINPLITLGVPS